MVSSLTAKHKHAKEQEKAAAAGDSPSRTRERSAPGSQDGQATSPKAPRKEDPAAIAISTAATSATTGSESIAAAPVEAAAVALPPPDSMSAEAAAEAAEVAADAKAAEKVGAQESDDSKAAEDQVDPDPAVDPADDEPPGKPAGPAIVKCEPREEALGLMGLGTALEHMEEEFADEDDDCFCTQIQHNPGQFVPIEAMKRVSAMLGASRSSDKDFGSPDSKKKKTSELASPDSTHSTVGNSTPTKAGTPRSDVKQKKSSERQPCLICGKQHVLMPKNSPYCYMHKESVEAARKQAVDNGGEALESWKAVYDDRAENRQHSENSFWNSKLDAPRGAVGDRGRNTTLSP